MYWTQEMLFKAFMDDKDRILLSMAAYATQSYFPYPIFPLPYDHLSMLTKVPTLEYQYLIALTNALQFFHMQSFSQAGRQIKAKSHDSLTFIAHNFHSKELKGIVKNAF